MNIEYKNNNTIKILLTKYDLNKYNITYEELDYKNIATKKFLHSILKNIHQISNINSYKIFIEAYPTKDDGCLLYINLEDKNKVKSSNSFNTPLIFIFDNINMLTNTCNKLFNENLYMIIKSSLYFYNDKYYLSIYSYCRMEEKLCNILKEYGHFIGKGSIFSSFLQEHSREIISENAIEIINKYL